MASINPCKICSVNDSDGFMTLLGGYTTSLCIDCYNAYWQRAVKNSSYEQFLFHKNLLEAVYKNIDIDNITEDRLKLLEQIHKDQQAMNRRLFFFTKNWVKHQQKTKKNNITRLVK